MIDLDSIRVNLSSLIFDNLINSQNNYSEMEEIFNQLKEEYSESEAELIMLDIIANVLVKSKNENYLVLLDNVYTNVLKTNFIMPLSKLKQDIINQNDYTYGSEDRISFYQTIINDETTSTEVKAHYNYLLLRELILSGIFLNEEYQSLYITTRNLNSTAQLDLKGYYNLKFFLAFFS